MFKTQPVLSCIREQKFSTFRLRLPVTHSTLPSAPHHNSTFVWSLSCMCADTVWCWQTQLSSSLSSCAVCLKQGYQWMKDKILSEEGRRQQAKLKELQAIAERLGCTLPQLAIGNTEWALLLSLFLSVCLSACLELRTGRVSSPSVSCLLCSGVWCWIVLCL